MSMHSHELVQAPAAWGQARSSDSGSAVMLSAIIVIPITLIMMVISSSLLHWFVLPVSACGILIGKDAVRWFRREYDVLDPRGIIGIIGLHFFWFSALLIPAIGFTPFPLAGVRDLDFRPWLGVMGLLNFAGIIFYQAIATWYANRPFTRPVKVRRGVPMRIGWLCGIAIVAGLISQVYLVARYGVFVKTDFGDQREFITGQGIPVLIKSSLPITLMFAVTCAHLLYSQRRRSILAAMIVLAILSAVSLLLNGLAGNRGSTVFAALWIAGLIHYYWRPVKHREAIILILCGVLFMFTYLFYKQYGVTGLTTFINQGSQAAAATGNDRTERSFEGMLVGDMSRAHIHAYSAFVLIDKPYDYELRWGGTIPGDILSIVPRWVYLSEYNAGGYAGKHVAGTEMIRGPGKFDPTIKTGREPRMWGIAGNMILNFGLWTVPIGYALLGLYVGWAQRATRKWQLTGDIRLFSAPLLAIIALIILAMDPQVFTMYMLRYFMLPIIILYIGSRSIGRYPVPSPASAS